MATLCPHHALSCIPDSYPLYCFILDDIPTLWLLSQLQQVSLRAISKHSKSTTQSYSLHSDTPYHSPNAMCNLAIVALLRTGGKAKSRTRISYFNCFWIHWPDCSFALAPHINGTSLKHWEDPGFHACFWAIFHWGWWKHDYTRMGGL